MIAPVVAKATDSVANDPPPKPLHRSSVSVRFQLMPSSTTLTTIVGYFHAKIDAFPEKNGFTFEESARGLKVQPIDDVWAYVLKNVNESHKHIERCYELYKVGAFDKPTEESRKFIMERCRAGAQFTMDLWYSAWLRSAKLPKHY